MNENVEIILSNGQVITGHVANAKEFIAGVVTPGEGASAFVDLSSKLADGQVKPMYINRAEIASIRELGIINAGPGAKKMNTFQDFNSTGFAK